MFWRYLSGRSNADASQSHARCQHVRPTFNSITFSVIPASRLLTLTKEFHFFDTAPECLREQWNLQSTLRRSIPHRCTATTNTMIFTESLNPVPLSPHRARMPPNPNNFSRDFTQCCTSSHHQLH